MSAINPPAPPAIEVLPPELAGNYGYLNQCLFVSSDPSQGVTGAAFQQAETLLPMLGRFAAGYEGCDRRAVVSMWLQIHLSNLVPPVFAASVFLHRTIPVELASVRVLVDARGMSTGFQVIGTGEPAAGDGIARFTGLVRHHIAPLIDAVAASTHVAKRLLWANAAASFQGIADVADHLPDAPPEAASYADQVLEAPTWPDGWRNPLHGLVRFAPTDHEHRHRIRRVCCLRHHLPDFDICPDCPKPPARR